MSETRENPFWDYSLLLYGRKAVAAACLDLQDRFSLDVNMLLFCCWAGARGRRLSEAEILRLIEAVQAWRTEVLLPLRSARRWLKTRAPAISPAAETLRERIKSSELAAEAVQQDLMHETLAVPDGKPSAAAVAANLCIYLSAEGVSNGETTEALATLLQGACPDLTTAEAQRLLSE